MSIDSATGIHFTDALRGAQTGGEVGGKTFLLIPAAAFTDDLQAHVCNGCSHLLTITDRNGLSPLLFNVADTRAPDRAKYTVCGNGRAQNPADYQTAFGSIGGITAVAVMFAELIPVGAKGSPLQDCPIGRFEQR